MRLWSLHPRYLDRQGLTAVWREGLLAQAVLLGKTRGYQHHPQLDRFRACAAPRGAISAYLHAVCREAARRGYQFDARRIRTRPAPVTLRVTRGQVAFEWVHLRRKLKARSPGVFAQWKGLSRPRVHPSFRVRAGGVEAWERGKAG